MTKLVTNDRDVRSDIENDGDDRRVLHRTEAIALLELGDLLRNLIVDPDAVDGEGEEHEKEIEPETVTGRRASIERFRGLRRCRGTKTGDRAQR